MTEADRAAVDRAAKLACARRELAFRRRCYPQWVAQGRMGEAEAAREIALMAAIAEDYADADPQPGLPL